MQNRNWIISATVLLAAAAAAQAGYTTVNYRNTAPTNPSERNQAEIMARFYGNGTFNRQNFALVGNNFVGQNNAAGDYTHLSFIRVEDFRDLPGATPLAQRTNLGGVLDIHATDSLGRPTITGMTDQVWRDGVVQVHADAKYAGFHQRAGFKYGASNDVPLNAANNHILDVTGVGNTVTALGDMRGVVTAVSATNQATFTASHHQQFRLTRSGNGSNYAANEWSSKVSENTADGVNGPLDHMITYQILDSRNPNLRRFMVFFDDQGGGGDRDFNDFSMTLSVVPLPPAAWAGLGTLAAIGSLSMVRRKRLSRV